MKKITEQLREIIDQEKAKTSSGQKLKELEQFLDELKKSGCIKAPDYTLPLVDTIGKTYYSSLNKRN